MYSVLPKDIQLKNTESCYYKFWKFSNNHHIYHVDISSLKNLDGAKMVVFLLTNPKRKPGPVPARNWSGYTLASFHTKIDIFYSTQNWPGSSVIY